MVEMENTKIYDASIPDLAQLECLWPKPWESDGELTLLRDLEFDVVLCDKDGQYNVLHFVVPFGFTTDLASDPLERRGTWDYGSVVHDYLYVLQGVVTSITGINYQFTRKQCDDIFLRIMDNCIPWHYLRYKETLLKVKNRITYLTVRLFGGRAWRT